MAEKNCLNSSTQSELIHIYDPPLCWVEQNYADDLGYSADEIMQSTPIDASMQASTLVALNLYCVSVSSLSLDMFSLLFTKYKLEKMVKLSW